MNLPRRPWWYRGRRRATPSRITAHLSAVAATTAALARWHVSR